jgi:hypothetical protein
MKLLRATESAVCLEFGACLGISAAYQATALALNKTGHLVSIDFYTVGLCWLGGSEETTYTKIALW